MKILLLLLLAFGCHAGIVKSTIHPVRTLKHFGHGVTRVAKITKAVFY